MEKQTNSVKLYLYSIKPECLLKIRQGLEDLTDYLTKIEYVDPVMATISPMFIVDTSSMLKRHAMMH